MLLPYTQPLQGPLGASPQIYWQTGEPNSGRDDKYRTETLGECMYLCTHMHHAYV